MQHILINLALNCPERLIFKGVFQSTLMLLSDVKLLACKAAFSLPLSLRQLDVYDTVVAMTMLLCKQTIQLLEATSQHLYFTFKNKSLGHHQKTPINPQNADLNTIFPQHSSHSKNIASCSVKTKKK
jgi:hypothetical protein